MERKLFEVCNFNYPDKEGVIQSREVFVLNESEEDVLGLSLTNVTEELKTKIVNTSKELQTLITEASKTSFRRFKKAKIKEA